MHGGGGGGGGVARVVPVYPWLRQDITSSYDYHVTKGMKRRESSWTRLETLIDVPGCKITTYW